MFSTYLYDGNNGSQTITNGINLSGEGGLVWVKGRDGSSPDHMLFDTERGVHETLVSNSSVAEVTRSTTLTAFNSNGFSLGGYVYTNGNLGDPFPTEYCSWTFRKAPGFFDCLTWSGNGSGDRYLNHNLASIPGCVIVKKTSGSMDWGVYHRSLGAVQTDGLELNNTNGVSATGTVNPIRSTPTSTQIYIRGGSNEYNDSGATYVAYLFAHDDQSFGTNSDEAIIKCGSYTGNGSTSNVVTVGFEPQWLLVKRTDGDGQDWHLFDVMRGMTGNSIARLYPNTNGAEAVGSGYGVQPLANGFEITASGTDFNGNNNDHIYVAIRRPHKPPEAGTDVFNPSTQVGTVPNFAASFPVDFGIKLFTSGGNTTYAQLAVARLLGEKYLATSQNNAEASPSGFSIDWDHMDGWGDKGGGGTGLSFKRAPGFMDVVAYTGDGTSGRTINHNLGVVPELWIFKKRSAIGNWTVGSSYLSNPTGDRLILDLNVAVAATGITAWTNTATTFLADYSGIYNASGAEYIAIFFASLSGISKVGTYTGTGNDGINVDCGFTAGARFVMIKRTDSTGNWFVWDSNRGIVSGNDPYIFLNSTSGQDTSTDHIDPLNSGFTVNGSNTAQINTSGGTYLFLAIA